MNAAAWGGPGTTDNRVAEVAHDLRMPLALILSQCEQLACSLGDGAQRAQVDQIRETARRMGRQVDGFVRVEEPRAAVDVAAVATEVATRFQPLARARSAEITLDCQGPAVVLGSESALELAIQNLLDNALRYARSTPVRITARRSRGHALIEVADDGPGIAPELREHLLTAGAQDTAVGRSAGAAGLGLSIAADTARAHGGVIRIGDAPEGGALVTLELPEPRPILRRPSRKLRAPVWRTPARS